MEAVENLSRDQNLNSEKVKMEEEKEEEKATEEETIQMNLPIV
jgi:hypothetical protein